MKEQEIQIQTSTKVMRYITYGILVLVIIAGLGAIFSGNSSSSSSSASTTSYEEEAMF